MKDIRTMNIWKEENTAKNRTQDYLDLDIVELCLSVRSYNCLKRAGCHTVGDILSCMDEDGQGLRKIRNLGLRSENEIKEKIESMKEVYKTIKPDVTAVSSNKKKLLKPRRSIGDRKVEDYNLSDRARIHFRKCGIITIRDLYKTNLDHEPGWYAVRELFEKVPY